MLIEILVYVLLKYIVLFLGFYGEIRIVGCGGIVSFFWVVYRVCLEEGVGYGGDVGYGDEDVWDVRV